MCKGVGWGGGTGWFGVWAKLSHFQGMTLYMVIHSFFYLLLGVHRQKTGEQRGEIEVLKRQADEESVKLEKRKVVIDQELADILPMVEEAQSAVGSIKPESLSEIRSLRAPPEVIRVILEGVLKLMGILDTSWVSMKRYG